MNNHFGILLLITTLFITSCGDPCDQTECLNDAICNDGYCECPEGFEGTYCEIKLSEVKKLLKRSENSEGRVDEYFYDNNGVLELHSYHTNDTSYVSVNEYTFNQDTMIQCLSFNDNNPYLLYKHYLLDPSTFIIEKYSKLLSGETILKEYSEYTFNTNCGLTHRRRVFDSKEHLVSYDYDSNSCNHLYTLTDHDGINQTSGYKIFDDKKNPIPNPWFEYLGITQRNVISLDVYILGADPNMESPATMTNTITYNKYDYPSHEIRTYNQEMITETSFWYYE